MTTVRWKEPWSIPRPVLLSGLVFTLLVVLPLESNSQWVSYKRSGRHSSLWHPNMPAARTLRHSSYSGSNTGSSHHGRDSHGQQPSGRSSSSPSGHRPIEHRSVSHSNYYTVPGSSSRDSSSSSGGAYHGQQQQPRYASADFGRNSAHSSASSGKNVRISDIPARSSPSSPTAATGSFQQQQQQQQQQRSHNYHHHQQSQSQIPSSTMAHRHLPMNNGGQKSPKANWQTAQKSGRSSVPSSVSSVVVQDSTKRPVSQQAGHLLDSWPNSNTHHHLAPVLNGAAAAQSKSVKNGFSNLKPEQWGNNVLVSNKPIEIGVKSKAVKTSAATMDAHKATDRQLILPSGYPLKDKTAVANTINTLTKLSPKKPIFVFMRKEGILAVKNGADAGDVIKKLAGTSKLPFYNGTNALPSHSMPTVFLAPEDMNPPGGYGKIPIPNLKPKNNATPKPTYTKILMPGGTNMKGMLITPPTTTTTTTTTPNPLPPLLQASPTTSLLEGGLEGIAGLLRNNSINTLSLDQKIQLLQLLRNQPNHPMADQVSMAILASASNPQETILPSPSAATPVSSPFVPGPSPSPFAPGAQQPALGSVVHGPTLAAPQYWPPNLFQGVLPPGSVIEGVPGQHPGPPQIPGYLGGILSSTTISSLLSGAGPSPSPSGVPAVDDGKLGETQDIHKLIGTIVESAVSNTVSTMLHHQRLTQQQQGQPSIIGVGPPLLAPTAPGAPSRPPPPPPPHFGRGPPPPHHRPLQGPPRPPFGYQQRHPFLSSPGGRFPPQQQPHPSAGPPPPPPPPSAIPQTPNPSAFPPQNPSASPSIAPNPFAQPSPSPYPNPTGAPPQQYPQQQQIISQASNPQPSGTYQHPIVPQFQLPSGYPMQSTLGPIVSTTPAPQMAFNPSSTLAPGQQYPHPNGIRQPTAKPPLVRMVERPFPGSGNKPRNPLHNALQFFGLSSPRPDSNSFSPSPSPTSVMMSSTPYPPRPTPTPFGRQGPPQLFPSSTPIPQLRQFHQHQPIQQQTLQNQQFQNSPQQQQQQFQNSPQQQQFQNSPQQQQFQNSPQQQQQFQNSPQQQQQQQQQSVQQQPIQQQQLQPGQLAPGGKKPTLIVQTPNGASGQKNTYVITGGGNELPELNKIMKVLNDLHVDSENAPTQHHPQQLPSPHPTFQQFSPSTPLATTPRPAIFNSMSTTFSPSSPSTPFSPTHRPFINGNFISPNVVIKNPNQGITPTPSPGVVSSPSTTTPAYQQQQFIASSTTPNSIVSPSSGRPHIFSSTSGPISPVSPIMQIIKSIQAQIPGVQVSPSVQTTAEKQQFHHPPSPQPPSPSSPRPILVSSPRPMVSVTPSPFLLSSPRPPAVVSASPGPIHFTSPRPQQQASPSPTPAPGQVIISSTGFPRVINISPSGSDTPQSIHQAVVEAIMKQQAAENGGVSPSPGNQIVVTAGGVGGLSHPGPTPQFIEVIPAGGALSGFGGDPNAKPFMVKLEQPAQQEQQQQPQQHWHSSNNHVNLPGIDINDPNIHIQRGSLESHETFTEKSQKQTVSTHTMSMSSSMEGGERPQPVYSREQHSGGGKIHHHSKEINDEYSGKDVRRRPSYGSSSKEHYDMTEEALNPNRRMYSGENSRQEGPSAEEQKLIEKVITEEKIVWKQGPGQGELIPSRVRTEERIIMRPGGGSSSSREVLDSEFSQRRTPVSSSELLPPGGGSSKQKVDNISLERLLQQDSSSKQVTSSAASQSKELSISSASNFAGILRSKMKFDKMMEKLYPTKQLVSPFTISNNSANFHHAHHHSKEIVPTIASSLVTTPQQGGFVMSSMGPTLPSLIGSTLGGLASPMPTVAGVDQGRFKIRPGDVLGHLPTAEDLQQQPGLLLGVSPSGQPMILQQQPLMPTGPAGTSATSEVEQRLFFIPEGPGATASNKATNPKILITTVDELPDLMKQLSGSGTNPEVRMVPDKATLERELAKLGASSTVEAQTQPSTSASTTTTTTPAPPTRLPSPSAMPPSPQSVQSTLFRIPPTEALNDNNVRRMDGPERAFTWRPQINATMASTIPTTNMPFDDNRRLVSGLGADMLHAMTAGFGNVENGMLNKYTWLGPSSLPPAQQMSHQQQPLPTQQVLYAMQNGIPLQLSTAMHHHQKMPIVGPYQQVLIQQQQQQQQQINHNPLKDGLPIPPGGAPLGYFSYNWGNLPEQQPPTAATSTTTDPALSKSNEFTLKYRSQYREDELPPQEKVKPVGPVHKLKKGVKARVKTTQRTTVSPIDPVSQEEYDDDDDMEQEELIPRESLVPKHAGRVKLRSGPLEEGSDEDASFSEDNRPSQQKQKQGGHRRRRPGKLTSADENDDDNERDSPRNRHKSKPHPTKPTYDEEDDASPAPKSIRAKQHGSSGKPQQHSNRRSDDVSSEGDVEDEDYEVYDVKPVYNVKKVKKPSPTAQPSTTVSTTAATSTTTAKTSKNKAIYVNREMFLVSGEERGKDGNNPKAEPVYQPSTPPQQQQPGLLGVGKYPLLPVPSIISGQSVVIKSGPVASTESKVSTTTTTVEPKPTSASTTTTTTTIAAPSTKGTSAKSQVTPTAAAGGKGKNDKSDDYKDTQDEFRSLLKKIQGMLSAQDEVYDFAEDPSLYDYYDDLQHQVHSTKATLTTTTKGTLKPTGKKNKKKSGDKKSKKKNGGKKNKKNGKKGKKNGNKKKGAKKNKAERNSATPKPQGNNKRIVAVTQSIPTRKPVPHQEQTTTVASTTATTPVVPFEPTAKVYLQHHQRHPVSSLEQFTKEEMQKPTTSSSTTTTTTTTTTTSTVRPPPVPMAHSSFEETISGEGRITGGDSSQQSGSVEQAGTGVSYVFSEKEKGKDNVPRRKKRPLWVRRRMGGVNNGGVVGASGEGLENLRTPTGPSGKVIRLVRRRRPVGGRRRMVQRQQQMLQQQSFEQQEPIRTSPTPQTTTTTTTSTPVSVEVAPPNYSSPPLEQYFEQNSLERRVGNSDSVEKVNGTVTLRSPKRKLKLIRLKGQRAQWRLRLQGNGEEDSSSEGGPRPAALVAPREVSAPLPLQAPLPAPIFTSEGLHPNSALTQRAAKSANNMISHYTTSFSSPSGYGSESSSVETKVCVRGKCEIVSRQ